MSQPVFSAYLDPALAEPALFRVLILEPPAAGPGKPPPGTAARLQPIGWIAIVARIFTLAGQILPLAPLFMVANVAYIAWLCRNRPSFHEGGSPDRMKRDRCHMPSRTLLLSAVSRCSIGGYALMKSGMVIEPSSAIEKPGLCAICQT